MATFNLLLEKLSRAVPSVQRGGKLYRWKSNYDYSELYVVFEFECYLKTPDGHFERNFVSDAETLCLYNIDSEEDWRYYLSYFKPATYRTRLREDYHDWIENQVESDIIDLLDSNEISEKDIDSTKEKIREMLLSDSDEFDYAKTNFESFETFIVHYQAEPIYGWVPDDDECFYTEDPTENAGSPLDDEVPIEVYEIFARHNFFKNRQVEVLRQYHQTDKHPRIWYLEPDSSLSDPPDGYSPVEIVSSWIPGDQALSVFREFKTFFDDHDGITNETTGFHINIRFSNKRANPKHIERFDWLRLAVLVQDETDLYRFGRSQNQYAKAMMKEFFKTLGKQSTALPVTLDSRGLRAFEKLLLKHFKPDKYNAINFTKYHDDVVLQARTGKKGFVEFRGPGNDYLGGRLKLTEKTIIKYMNAMFATQQPQYETEYWLRLNRLYQSMMGLEKGTHFYYSPKLTRHLLDQVVRKMTFTQILQEFVEFTETLEDSTTPIFPKNFNRLGLKIDLREKSYLFMRKFMNNQNFWIMSALYAVIVLPMSESARIQRLTVLKRTLDKEKNVSLYQTYRFLLQELEMNKKQVPESVNDFIEEQTYGDGTKKHEIFVGIFANKKYYIPKLQVLLNNVLTVATFIWDDSEVLEKADCFEKRNGMANTDSLLKNTGSQLIAETIRDVRKIMNDDTWYLPSIEELIYIDKQIRFNIDEQYRKMILRNGQNSFIWSSTEIDMAWASSEVWVVTENGEPVKKKKDEWGAIYLVRSQPA